MDVFLNPGAYFVGNERHRIRTLLGSCVSITLWHPGLRIGAMSHFLLAERGSRVTGPLDARYGEEALSLMLTELGHHGVAPAACEAKIFGGGDMFPQYVRRGAMGHVGRQNGEAARILLERQGIRIVSESLFGVGHRKIMFDIKNGQVWAQQVTPIDAQASSGKNSA